MDTEFAAIRDGLQRLRETSNPLEVFGAEAHGYRVNPTLAEQDVQKFETRYGVTLPIEYRNFLLHVGNGGAGPSYGLFKLGEMDDGWGHAPWTEDGGFVGVLSRPFPHTSPWNDRSEEPEFDEDQEDDPSWEEEYQQKVTDWERRIYWNTELVHGAIPICHLGCAYRQWLIVTGEEKGNVWDDDRVDLGGLSPVMEENKVRVTFLEWYKSWLDNALEKLS